MGKGPTLGLHTKAEQDLAFVMARDAAANGEKARARGDTPSYQRVVGYLMAIEDLAMAEDVPGLARKVRSLLRGLGVEE